MKKKPKKLTATMLLSVMRSRRSREAREYSFREDLRRIYRDGFTDGWFAREENGRVGDDVIE